MTDQASEGNEGPIDAMPARAALTQEDWQKAIVLLGLTEHIQAHVGAGASARDQAVVFQISANFVAAFNRASNKLAQELVASFAESKAGSVPILQRYDALELLADAVTKEGAVQLDGAPLLLSRQNASAGKAGILQLAYANG